MVALKPTAEAEPAKPPSELDRFAATVAERQADLAEGIKQAGLTRDPYRHVLEALSGVLGLLPWAARLAARPPTPLRGEQWAEMRQDIRGAVSAETRSTLLHVVLAVDRLRVALYVAVPLVTLGLGYWLGAARPVQTDLGPLPREVAEVLRANDLAASWHSCRRQPPQLGREWCYMPLWLSSPAPGGR